MTMEVFGGQRDARAERLLRVARFVRVERVGRASLVLPETVCVTVQRWLGYVARGLVSLGVSANAVTCLSLALGGGAGVLLALGQFPLAALFMVLSSLGDALDGMVARASGSSSVGGALLDASGDRYQESFLIGGLAVYLRESPVALVLALAALAGSFMVSYGSAKAEALGAPVPAGIMRRAERAVCLCLAVVLVTPWTWLAHRSGLAPWTDSLPLLIALGAIGLLANASAVRRLQRIAEGSKRAG